MCGLSWYLMGSLSRLVLITTCWKVQLPSGWGELGPGSRARASDVCSWTSTQPWRYLTFQHLYKGCEPLPKFPTKQNWNPWGGLEEEPYCNPHAEPYAHPQYGPATLHIGFRSYDAWTGTKEEAPAARSHPRGGNASCSAAASRLLLLAPQWDQDGLFEAIIPY